MRAQAAPAPGPKVTSAKQASIAKLDPPVCTVSIFGQCLVSKRGQNEAEAAKQSRPA